MITAMTRRRVRVCLVLALAVFLVFGLRLFQIQGVDAKAYAAMAVQNGTATTTVPAPRGAIVDRNGVELASNTDGLTVTADPSMTSEHAPQIARILYEQLPGEIDYFDTIEKLRTPDSRFVYVVRDIPASEASDAVKAVRDAKYTGVFTEKENLRSYPGGSLAANLLGFTDNSGKGVQGIEQMFDDQLTGTDGSSTYEVSSTGQRIPMADNTVEEMVPGTAVKTTIDRDLQWFADQRLSEVVSSTGSAWGLAITMDVKTCQILQMSQAPTFNPDTRQGITDQNTVSRATQTVYEPGSVMKPVTMAALADQGLINADSKVRVPESMTIDGFRIGDHWDHGVLQMTAAGVIAQSSNLGTIVAAQQMDDQTFYDYLRKFGFGEQTGVGLPGESAGIVEDADSWTRAKHATTAFGQGISVTGVQMLRAIGVIANDGMGCDPTVVESTIAPDGTEKKIEQDEPERVVSPEAAAQVTRMMEAVTADDGTAPLAQVDGYRVAGKTGTAWRVDPDTGRYLRGQNLVSFVGFAPADKPRFVTYIVIDKAPGGAGGGSLAAPIFHDIMSMALERFGVMPTGSPSPEVAQYW
ncbi:penicillin-binding protein 2 [Aeromicrobium sp. YIM 150415]|uniref:peptidoglycan D,D-transpeptidase FtsI family protein n=1 Tax=Aeromicrobium sp. YIM 150415 TaxID=2803912 RepID=UPI001963E3D5|nr:penicillin-binding protein 2 [Aeromicrobium sp. YIM 150415]MBM9464329.1 penicillin-binding protein 2 [Aeromicrobium sp. YIM 150415]